MAFLWGDLLWLFSALPALLAGYVLLLHRRRTDVLRYSDCELLREAMGPAGRIRLHITALIFFLALVALITSIARPTAAVIAPYERRTIVLAIDVSMSMAATDVVPNRLAAAQSAARAFIRKQPPGARIGVVAFSTLADVVQYPTSSREEGMRAMDRLTLQHGTGVGTGIIAALLMIYPHTDLVHDYDIFGRGGSPAEQLPIASEKKTNDRSTSISPDSDSSAAIIVLTDGRTTIGIPPMRAAKMAADAGIRIYTVGIGTEGGGSIEVEGRRLEASFDEDVLRRIAGLTGGEYFRATDGAELTKIYERLSGRVLFERKEQEITALFTAIGAALLLISATLSLLWCNLR